MMVTVDEVKNFHGLQPKHLKFNDNEVTKMNDLLTSYILQAEDFIISYTNNESLKTNTPPAVQNVCLRIVDNMIVLMIARRDSPIIKVNDWKVSTISSNIFTDDLRRDLEPYRKDKSNKSDKIDFFAITGE